MQIIPESRRCTKCGIVKPSSEFHRSSSNPLGIRTRCKPCHLEDRLNWKKSKAGKINKISENFKRRAKKFNCDGLCSPSDIKAALEAANNRCLKCGNDENVSVDHVIPLSLGGTNTLDNLQVLCFSCNAKKHASIVDYRT